MARLDGLVALSTGAASGIGAATAARFAAEGAAIIGLDLAKPAEVADCGQEGGHAATLSLVAVDS